MPQKLNKKSSTKNKPLQIFFNDRIKSDNFIFFIVNIWVEVGCYTDIFPFFYLFALNSNHLLSVCVFNLIKQAIGLYNKPAQALHTASDKQEGKNN